MADTGQTTKTIKIKIVGETRKATDEIKKLNAQIKGLNKQVGKSGKGMSNTTKKVKGLSLGFKQLTAHLARLVVIYGSFKAISSTVTTFAKFEQSIKTLGAVSGSTGEELKALEVKAKDLGETTVFSASQVADGMIEMARAGLSAGEQIAGIKGVLDLAIVGNLDLAEATKVATGAMNGFGLEAEQLGTVSDVIAQGANDSAQSVSELGQAMSKVAPVARTMNNSLMETTAFLETLADNQIKGALAGTKLKIAMLRLSANNEVKKYLDELSVASGGMSTAMADAKGNVLPLTKQLEKLKTATANMTEEAKIMYLTRIVGTEAISGFLVLLDNMDKTQAHLDKLRKSFGYASKASDEMMNSLTGSYKELISALEGLQIKIGENLSPALRGLIDDSTEFIRSLDAEEIGKFSDALVGLVTVMGTVFSGVGEIIKTMGDMLQLVPKNADATDKFRGVLDNFNKSLTILIGTLIIFRKELLANPITAVLTIGTGVILAEIEVLTSYQDEMKSLQLAFNKTADEGKKFYGLLDKVYKGNIGKKTVKEIKELDDALLKEKRTIKKLIAINNAHIKSVNTQMISSARKKKMTDDLRKANKLLESRLKKLGKAQIFVRDKGNEVTNALDKQKKATDDHTKAILKNSKAVLKAEVSYEARKKSLEKTLGTMSKKERAYTKQMQKLDAELAKSRHDHEISRLQAESDFTNRIADLRGSALSELGQYNDAQIRADKQLALAKEAIKKGEFDKAKVYYDEYMQLIKVNATEEIKEGEKVVRTKKDGIAELIHDETAGHSVEMALLANKNKAEEDAIIAKKVALQAEMVMLKVQMKLQVAQIEILKTMLNAIGNHKFDKSFANFKKEADKMEKELDALANKQTVMKVTGKLDQKALDSDKKKLETEKIKANLDIDPSEAEGTITTFKTSVLNGDGKITGTFDLSTEQGLLDAKEAKDKIEQDVVSPDYMLNTDTGVAEANSAKALIESKPILPKYNIITTTADANVRSSIARIPKVINTTWIVTKRVISANSTGGLIQKFAEGGHLDNGLGHTSKSGSLGGYGGGDKIKALLEAGEFIVRKEAVRALGLARLNTINQGQIPKFATGGKVGSIPKFATGGSIQSKKTVNLNLNVGGQTFQTVADEDVATALANHLKRSRF